MKAAASATIGMLLAIASTARAQPATTRPAPAPDVGAPVITVFLPDLCESAVDPFYPGRERERFFRAAGADNELTADEFLSDARRKHAFVRVFDRWDALLVYDTDAGETIDWTEAKRYRLAFGKKVVALFDADGDRRLTRQERNEANRALATGKATPDTFESLLEFAEGLEGLLDELPEQLGEVSGPADVEGPQSHARGVNRQAIGTQIRRRIASPAQVLGGTRGLIPLGRIRGALLARFLDGNGDGRLSGPERQNADSFVRRLSYPVLRSLRRSMDLNGNGRVSPAETATFVAEINHASSSLTSKLARAADSNSDGVVSDVEARNFADKVVGSVLMWAESFCLACDENGDGRFSRMGLRLLVRAISRELARRTERHDADNDGRLNGRQIIELVTALAEHMHVLPGPVRTGSPTGQSE